MILKEMSALNYCVFALEHDFSTTDVGFSSNKSAHRAPGFLSLRKRVLPREQLRKSPSGLENCRLKSPNCLISWHSCNRNLFMAGQYYKKFQADFKWIWTLIEAWVSEQIRQALMAHISARKTVVWIHPSLLSDGTLLIAYLHCRFSSKCTGELFTSE